MGFLPSSDWNLTQLFHFYIGDSLPIFLKMERLSDIFFSWISRSLIWKKGKIKFCRFSRAQLWLKNNSENSLVVQWLRLCTPNAGGPDPCSGTRLHVCVYVFVLRCVRLHDPVDCSPTGSSVHGISQARVLEWVAMPPPGDLPDPGMEPAISCTAATSLPLPRLGSPEPTRRSQMHATTRAESSQMMCF